MPNVHRFRFPVTRRIRSSVEFKGVFNSGLYAADDVLVINGRRRIVPSNPTRLDQQPAQATASADSARTVLETRLGLSIGTVVGHSPRRNRWKRLIREAFRLNHHQIPAGWDLVVRPKKGADPDFHRICRSLIALTRRIDTKAHRP
jgi:ribonuclease P protein component